MEEKTGTRYDPAKPRRAQRAGREKGIRIYVAAAELRKAGIDPDGDPPTYKVWGMERGGGSGSVMVRFYTDP